MTLYCNYETIAHEMPTTITRYGGRYWAVYVNGQLLVVTVYKKGAIAVQDALARASRKRFRSSADNGGGPN